MTTLTSIADFQQALDARGLVAALAFLNQRVPHRFTAVYQLSDQRLRRLGFIDKQGSSGEELADLPFKDSFCEISVREGGLVTTEASTDKRLDGNPYQAMVGSYVGLPLSAAPGELFGTFCHYDFCKQAIGNDEFLFLEQTSQRLARFCTQNGVSA
jgi:hypothetical protein